MTDLFLHAQCILSRSKWSTRVGGPKNETKQQNCTQTDGGTETYGPFDHHPLMIAHWSFTTTFVSCAKTNGHSQQAGANSCLWQAHIHIAPQHVSSSDSCHSERHANNLQSTAGHSAASCSAPSFSPECSPTQSRVCRNEWMTTQ